MQLDVLVANVLLVLLQLHGNLAIECGVDDCTQWFSRTKDYESVPEGSSPQYCQILETYIKCLSATITSCRGNLKFHSIDYLMKKQWSDFRCQASNLQRTNHNRCHFVPAASQRSIRYCTLFGHSHLRMFDGSFESCTERGATTLVDNRHMLVQVTFAQNLAQDNVITRITVLLRKHNCTIRQLLYQTSTEDSGLSSSFDDGITKVEVDRQRKSIEILRHSVDYVELNLRYIDSSLHIRRHGDYLSISIRAPDMVIQNSEEPSLCATGCYANTELSQLFSAPDDFSQCQARRLQVPLPMAQQRCRTMNTTDMFLDACVYDLMMTGDDSLVKMSQDSQQDFQRVFPLHYHYIHGRNTITRLPNVTFDECVVSAHSRIYHVLIVFLCILIQFFQHMFF